MTDNGEAATVNKMATLLLAGVMASVAFAGLDPDTDSVGVYFDQAGNSNCTTAGAFQPVTAYLLLMNPAGPTYGFACTVAMTGAPHVVLGLDCPPVCNDCDLLSGPYNLAFGCGADFLVPATGAVVVVTWTILLLEPSEMLFYVGPHEPPLMPGGLPVAAGNGVLRLCRVASGDVNLPVAGINVGNCPVSEDVNSFGSVKGLFR